MLRIAQSEQMVPWQKLANEQVIGVVDDLIRDGQDTGPEGVP